MARFILNWFYKRAKSTKGNWTDEVNKSSVRQRRAFYCGESLSQASKRNQFKRIGGTLIEGAPDLRVKIDPVDKLMQVRKNSVAQTFSNQFSAASICGLQKFQSWIPGAST